MKLQTILNRLQKLHPKEIDLSLGRVRNLCKKLGNPWKEFKTNHMKLGRINIRTQSSRANESPTNANYRGVGLAEMAYSIDKKRIHRCNGEVSLHVLDLIQSTMNSAKTNKAVKLTTSCKIPKLFTYKEIQKIMR